MYYRSDKKGREPVLAPLGQLCHLVLWAIHADRPEQPHLPGVSRGLRLRPHHQSWEVRAGSISSGDGGLELRL
jgi:hypothetical protein